MNRRDEYYYMLAQSKMPSEIRDGKTFGYWDWLVNLVTDSSGYSSAWIDKLNGLSMVQASAGSQPLRGDGLVFDGTNDNIKLTGLSIPQPFTVYLVINQLSFTSSDAIISFNPSSICAYYQTFGSTFTRLNAGSGINYSSSAYNTKQLHTLVFDGANSSIQINNLTKATGNIGATSMTEVALGIGYGLGYGNFSAFDLLVRLQADGDALQNTFKQFLARKNGIVL